MKKTYIEPKNTIVALKVRSSIMSMSGNDGDGNNLFGDGGDTSGKVITPDARQTISAPDAWEEW